MNAKSNVTPYSSTFKKATKIPDYKVLDKMPDMEAVKDHKHYLLFEMLTWMRPDGSKHEKNFVEKYISTIPGAYSDSYGNYYVAVGEDPTVMFSAHTDTVHHAGGFQNLIFSEEDQVITADNSSCLGADDTTGIYIMKKMIEAGVKGLYVFHRAEEVGCQGSQFILDNHPEVLERCNVAIAFDRKGTNDIITHQTTGKCASKDAAQQLSDMMFEHGLGMTANENGIFTDTAYYNSHISECFNLSVGYYDQHTPRESQDLKWLDVFIEACLKVDWHSISPVRDVSDTGYPGYGAFGYSDFDYSDFRHGSSKKSRERSIKVLAYLAKADPETMAEYLIDYLGITELDLEQDMSAHFGMAYEDVAYYVDIMDEEEDVA